jgi:NitT/TauT family transport system permease protein
MSSIAEPTSAAARPTLGRADQQAALAVRFGGVWLTGLVAALAWAAATAYIAWWPGQMVMADPTLLIQFTAIVALVLLAVSLIGTRAPAVLNALQPLGAWFIALAIVLIAWEAVTAKLGILPRPFFSTPQGILNVYFQDFPKLSESLLHSIRLLAIGYVVGGITGFLTGIAIGWWKIAGYWLHPILRFIGPLPATAWLPIAFFLFPTSFSASTFLVALASGVPVTILTWSGIASVNKDYFDIARTMGASQHFLVQKVAVPAALPHVFVGLFMGLGSAFAVLVVAEMLGVKAGLGWYLQWAQGWAAYDNMYAALALMAMMCSSLVTLLFWVRDRTLAWQKELVRW